MAGIGLFTRQDLKSVAAKRPEISRERMREMGTHGIRGMNPSARHPEMSPSGSSRPEIYVLGEMPSETDDEYGEPFAGKDGNFLCSAFPNGYEKIVRFNNCCRTRPVDAHGKTRLPNEIEIECFRPSIERDIADTKPLAILATGYVPLRWMLDDAVLNLRNPVSACRGRRFPVRILDHECWFYPIMHPSYVRRIKDAGRVEDVPGPEWESTFRDDVRHCFDSAPDPLPRIEDPRRVFDQIEILDASSEGTAHILGFLRHAIATRRLVSIDIETNRLRPYEKGARILTIALATMEETIAFPFTSAVRKALIEFFSSQCPRCAHNAPFETEWLLHEFGELIFNGVWHCSQAQAYILDEREGGQGLDFLCRMYFGLPLKSVSDLDRAHLEREPIDKVLRYNGADAKYGRRLFAVQRARLMARKQDEIYREQIERIPGIVLAQHAGMVRDETEIARLQTDLQQKASRIKNEIQSLDVVRKYCARYGEFDCGSNGMTKQVMHMFKDFLKRKEGAKKLGKYTIDEEALSRMTDEPLAQSILDLRNVHKLRSTYVDPLDSASEKSVVYPDGKLHSIFKPTFTRSGRLSGEDPNPQNFPKRQASYIRKCIAAAADEVLIAADYKQLEACGIAIHSNDKRLVDALWTGYDIHAAWAKRINDIYPECSKKLFADMEPEKAFKAFRAKTKNALVFPAFYLASEQSIRGYLDLPNDIARQLFREFWREFNGVKDWQNDMIRQYQQCGYVEALNGRRRHGPLSENQIVNSPIQGFCSDIVCIAWAKLVDKALETGAMFLAPFLNVHDDLTLRVPKREAPYVIKEMQRIMTAKPYPFVQVPLAIEISQGQNWYEMEEICTYVNPPLRAA